MKTISLLTEQSKQRGQRVSRILAVLIAIVAALVLLGWLFDIETFKRPLPNLVAMNPLTAICFILSCVSLIFLNQPVNKKQWQRIGYAAALIVLSAVIIKLSGLINGFDTHIDSLLFHNKLQNEVVKNISNKMAPNTALAFVFSSIALLLINVHTKKHSPSQYIVLFTFFLGMLSVIGYLYKIGIFYGFLSYIPMAIHTALCFVLLSVAILYVHPDKGLMAEFTSPHAGGLMARILIPATIIIPIFLGFLRLYSTWNGQVSLEFGAAILILSNISIFLILVWFITRELNKKDILKQQAERELMVVIHELEAFTYSVAHDLRSPLRTVNMYAQLLQKNHITTMNDDGKRMVDSIKNNVTKMDKLIEDLLAFSYIGRKELDKEIIDMNVLTKDVVEEFSRNVTNHAQINIGNLHSIQGDDSLLRQVILNLVSNAVKYSSKKENSVVQIASEKKGNEIIFSVKDNGAGFDMKYASKLFEVFQRLHAQNEFEGTGVGLAIIERIITKHGGRVWADAKEDEGASFFFSIPV